MNVKTWMCGPPPASGQRQRYPSRFQYNLKRYYPEFFSGKTLHMFCGSCEWGITTDIRPETGAQIVAPYDAIPLPDGSVDNVIADPPYANYYANEWKTKLPKPKWILREGTRLVVEGGLIGILHILIVPAYKILHVTRVALHPILTGPGNVIRVFNVFRKGSEISKPAVLPLSVYGGTKNVGKQC